MAVRWPLLVGLCLSFSGVARADQAGTFKLAGRSEAACIPEPAPQVADACPAEIKKFTPGEGKPAGPKITGPRPAAGPKETKPAGAGGIIVEYRPRNPGAEARSMRLLVNEIAQLEELWKATARDSADRAPIARRLAESYVELGRAAFRDRVEAEIRKDQPAADRAKKSLDAARSSAIKYYRVIVNDHRTYAQLDEVLYYLAYEHEQAQNFDEARKVYLQLISDTPRSRYIPSAYLAFGELFFSEAQADPSKLELARLSYQKVLEYDEKTSKVWGYARYKLGHVHWQLGGRENLGKALASFKETIEYGDRHATEPGVAALQKNARKDIIPVYALVGKPGEAHGFLRPLSGDKGSERATFAMMDALGDSYLDTGHYPEAIALYEDLSRRDKGDESCRYQARITQATLALKGGGDKATVRQKLGELAARARAFRGEEHAEEAKNRCSSATVELLYETAASWHVEAVGSGGVRGTGDRNTMKLAAEVYDLIATTYAKEDFGRLEFARIAREDWPSLAKIRYARADLLYTQGDWERCGAAFNAVVDEEPAGPDAAEAAYAAVLCAQKFYDQTHATRDPRREKPQERGPRAGRARPGREEPAGPPPRRELTEAEKGMLRAFDRYLCYVAPKEDAAARGQLAEIKFARGRIHFDARHLEDAARDFRDVALNHADHEVGLIAAQLYLESLNALLRVPPG